MYYPSGYYRKKALLALKGHWQPALLVALIVNLPTMLIQGFSAFTGNDVMTRLQNVILTTSRDGVLNQDMLVQEINTMLSSTAFWIIRGLELLALLVTPCLALGMYKWLMDLLHGQEQPVNAVFCRMKYFFKALGLQLLVILKVLLWMLPGIIAAGFLVYPAVQATTQQAQMEALMKSQAYSLPVLLLMIVPGAIAALRYALAEYIQAEKPENKIRFCLRHSRELTDGKKKNLFTLVLSFLLFYLLELLVAGMLSGVLSLVFQMLIGLVLNVWMACAVSAFYLRLEEGKEGDPSTPSRSAQDDTECNPDDPEQLN